MSACLSITSVPVHVRSFQQRIPPGNMLSLLPDESEKRCHLVARVLGSSYRTAKSSRHI